MTFIHPLALLWLLAAVAVVLLYRRRLRLRQEQVATDMLWQRVFAAEDKRDAWQRWRHPVSLAVQLTVLLLLVLAAAEPRIPGPRCVVLVVDNSAGCTAADGGLTRLDQAKETARRLIGRLRACDSAAVLSTGGTVGVRCTLTDNHQALEEAVASIEPVRAPARMTPAVEVARRMLGERPRGEIKLLTDGCFAGAEELAAAKHVELIRVGQPVGNAAVTRLAARRLPGESQRGHVLVEVTNFSEADVTCTLVLTLDAATVEERSITVSPGGGRPTIFDLPSVPDAGTLTARLAHDDAYAEDNQLAMQLSAAEDRPDTELDVELLTDAWATAAESDLRAPGDLGTAAASVAAGGAGLPGWLILLVAALALLTTEWCFYQRRWIS